MASWLGDLVFGIVTVAIGGVLVFNLGGLAGAAAASPRWARRGMAQSMGFWRSVGAVWLGLGLLALLAAANAALRK